VTFRVVVWRWPFLMPQLLHVLFGFLLLSEVHAADPRQSKSSMLSLEFELQLPYATSGSVWSNDGSILVIIPFSHPALQLVDVTQRQLREWTTPFPFQFLSTAISPDNQLLAIHQPINGQNALWLYSIADRREIARVTPPVDNCSLDFSAPGGLMFSPDGEALWLGCTSLPVTTDRYPVAVKLHVPSLQIQGRIDLAPVLDAPAGSKRTRLSHYEGKILATHMLLSYTSPPQPLKIAQDFLRAIDLGENKEIFPTLGIRTDTGQRFPTLLQSALVPAQGNFAIVFRKLIQRRPPPPPGTPDFAFETYDAASGPLVREFWSGKEQQDLELGGQLEDAALIPNSTYVVGAIDASFNSQKHGGLIIWDWRTGEIVERAPGRSAQRVSVSPDGKFIALVSSPSLLVYRVDH